MKRKLLLFTLLVIVMNGTLFAKNEEKEIFDILVEYRADIPEGVIKKVRKEMGTDTYRYPRIHDSWIENPEGKSIDLNGNVLFPEIDYKECKQVSPTHFELDDFYYLTGHKKGVVRADGKVIVPVENRMLHYFPLFNIIVAQVDWETYGSPNKGQVKIYDYFGNLLYSFDDVSNIVGIEPLYTYGNQPKEIKMNVGAKEEKLTFERYRSDEEQDLISRYYCDGPQAVTYNIIRQLCASNKKGDQKKALKLLEYFILNIVPQDDFNNRNSTLAWDVTIRQLACVNYTKDYSYFGMGDNANHHGFPFRYVYIRDDERGPHMLMNNPNLPKNDGLAAQAEQLMWLAYNDYENKKMRNQERAEMWLAVLGVLSNALGQNGSYTPASGSGTSINTTSIPPIQTGNSMLDQTVVSPEVMGAAISAGWQPESPSTTSDTSTSTSSHSTTGKRICHACFGKGIHQACNGTGNLVAFGNKRLEKCTGCNGTGKCPHCNGGYY